MSTAQTGNDSVLDYCIDKVDVKEDDNDDGGGGGGGIDNGLWLSITGEKSFFTLSTKCINVQCNVTIYLHAITNNYVFFNLLGSSAQGSCISL